MPLLVLGTGNRKKGIELALLLQPLGVEVRTLADFPQAISVEETGETFEENSRLKAAQQAKHLKHWVLGEDSGLCVEALLNAPGVYSARYSGPQATDEANNHKLLTELGKIPLDARGAYYVCHASLSDPNGRICAESEDYCRGRILFAPRGEEGFGYDPLFEIVEYHKTFAELGLTVKGVLSHRARAIRSILPLFQKLLDSGEWQ